MGACILGKELEGAQLQNNDVTLLDLAGLRQQGMTDVTAKMDRLSRSTQHLGNDGGSGGLTIASGHSNDGTGADGEEHLHLAGKAASLLHGSFQLRKIRPHTGGAENDILIQTFQVSLPQL